MPLDYESEVKKAFAKNRRNVVKNMEDGRRDEVIDNFCKLHGFKRKDVENEIRTNKIVAALFSFDPTKQGIHEKIAANYITKIKGVSKFENLPSSKYNVVNGTIYTRKELKAKGLYARAKTIDFYWGYKNCDFYAAHKHTKSEGGAQGNQYKDLQEFIIQSRGNKKRKTFFIAIADGDFYQGENGQAGILRIEKLQDLADKPYIAACTINELESVMKTLAKI